MHAVGIDIGFGDVKILGSNLCTAFPTLITPYNEEVFSTGIGEDIVPVETNGSLYLVGNDAKRAPFTLDVRYKTWFMEDLYLAFFKKGLTFVKPGNIMIVTGLPVSEFNECKDNLKKRLRGTYVIKGNTYWVQDVRVMPQPFGSYFNYILDANGHVDKTDKLHNTIGIFDIGYRTTDFILITDGKQHEGMASGTLDVGVSNLVDRLIKQAKELYNLDLTHERARNALLTKEIKLYGKPYGIKDLVDKEVAYWAEFITHTAKTNWKSGAHVDEILLVGGGAELFAGQITKLFPHVRVPGNPAYSNAAGYYKFGMNKLPD